MTRRWTTALTVALGLLATSPAQALQLSGRKGIGYASAVGGPRGLAFAYGAGIFVLEGIVGLQYQVFDEPDRDDAASLDFAFAGHFQLLQGKSASLTTGLRLNLLTGRVESEEQGVVETKDLLQWGVDVPVRVYWFPDPHISVHLELGIAFLVGPEDGVLTEGLTPNGYRIDVFEPAPLGGLGLTFWWG